MMTRKCPKSGCFVICNGDCLFCERTYFGGMTDLQYIESTGTQYIDTGVPPVAECKPYTVPLHGIKMYDGDKLIHDYKPCLNPEGVEGVYDFIDEVFLSTEEIVSKMVEHYRNADKIWTTIGGSSE